MEGSSYDLGSLCSSPILYGEGEDFLGQPVNMFFDEDISFDFIDSFEDGFSIAGNVNEVLKTGHEKDRHLLFETPTLPTTQPKDFGNTEKTFDIQADKMFIGVANEELHVSEKENSASLCASTSESINTCTHEDKASTEDTDLRTLPETAQELTKNVTTQSSAELDDKRTLSKSAHDKNHVTASAQAENISNTSGDVSTEDFKQNFEENTYINSNFNAGKPALNNVKLLSRERQIDTAGAIQRKNLNTTNFQKMDNASFGLKHSGLKRCVVPKTFYSPFWTPDKSTAKHEKSLEDGLVNAQRNVDILYCCNCKSQKPYSRFAAAKPASSLTSGYKDRHNYIDFLKRNSALEPQRNCQKKAHNKTINEEISSKISLNEAHNEERWISLPPIYTSKTLRQKGVGSKPNDGLYLKTLSVASIDGLINKYKGKHFDLVEQQKRYQLKPFK